MTSDDHKKHAFLNRPSYGNFNRNEWTILGAECNLIQQFAFTVIDALSSQYKCGYADAKHSKDEEKITLPGHLNAGAVVQYSFESDHHQFLSISPQNNFRLRNQFSETDLVIVNGNHHTAQAQVVLIDDQKKGSLQRKLDRLTNVQLFILTGNNEDIYDFLKEAIPEWQCMPVYRIDETEKIVSFFKQQLLKNTPLINGLVLAGGKSSRMGQDKGSIKWHGKEQNYHMADMLRSCCGDAFISCRTDQANEIDGGYKTLTDTFTGIGPYGAILSAFREFPDKAWLVTACDLPLLNSDTLQYLIENRDPSSIATTFESPYDGLPEPLITIWEPKSYPVLLWFLSLGYSCPRKVLRNNPVTILQAPDPDALKNIDTPLELEEVKELMRKKQLAGF